jgi:AraC-like DNA-binding protein
MTRQVGPPRGILHTPPASGVFHHARLAPPASLAYFVQNFWIVRWDLPPNASQRAETLPHPNVHLALEQHAGRIYGVLDGRFTRTLEGAGGVFGVKFRAGGFRPFLGRSVATLRNRYIAFEEVFGAPASRLLDELFSASGDSQMAEVVARFLTSRLPAEDPHVDRIAGIVEGIAADPTIVSVDQVGERCAMGKRTLQRLFNEYVGTTPKWVINRYRLHEALARLHSGAELDWAQLAVDLGYFDQSHFIRDFRAVVGLSPAQYLRTRETSASPTL